MTTNSHQEKEKVKLVVTKNITNIFIDVAIFLFDWSQKLDDVKFSRKRSFFF